LKWPNVRRNQPPLVSTTVDGVDDTVPVTGDGSVM
jgi:hypothetical protein